MKKRRYTRIFIQMLKHTKPKRIRDLTTIASAYRSEATLLELQQEIDNNREEPMKASL